MFDIVAQKKYINYKLLKLIINKSEKNTIYSEYL